MGVQGLWDEVKAARETTTWSQLSDSHFRSKESGARGLRVGIDLSIWIYQAKKTTSLQNDDGEHVNAGANADLRTIFYRTCELLRRGILAVFVADGKARPEFKRGKKRAGDSGEWESKVNKLFNMFRLMGMEVRRAPGEAEAELAVMAKRGEIDAVLSDDVDSFLFGSPLLIRIPPTVSSKAKSDAAISTSNRTPSIEEALSELYPPIEQDYKGIIHTYSLDTIKRKTGWMQDDMIFFALFSGGDYGIGLAGCGAVLVKALIRGGYARRLMDQIRNTVGYGEARAKRLKEWREEVAEVFRTNPDRLFDSKHPALAQTLSDMDNFPDTSIIDSYLFPLVSDPNSSNYTVPTWNADVNLKQLIPFVSRLFEWGHEQVICKFRSKVWIGILMRQLRRKALELDGGRKITSLARVKSIVAYSSASTTDFAPSYSVHLDSTIYDSLITPCLPKIDPFPFPDYDSLTTSEVERIKEERKKAGKAQNSPKAPETGDFRFYVPVGFIAVDEDCRGKVKKWGQGVERQKKRKEGKVDDAEDSDERDANDAKEEREKKKQAQMREEMRARAGMKGKEKEKEQEKEKEKEKEKGKENSVVGPIQKKRKIVESTKSSTTSKMIPSATSQDSDTVIAESNPPAQPISRLRRPPKKSVPSLSNSFALSKPSSFASASTSKKPSSPIVLSSVSSSPSSASSSLSFTKSSRKRSLTSNTSPDTTIDFDADTTTSIVKKRRLSTPPAHLTSDDGERVGKELENDSGIVSSSFMADDFDIFTRPRESATLSCLQELKDAGYLRKKEVETLVLSDSD